MMIERLIYPTEQHGQMQGPGPESLTKLIGMLQALEKFSPGLKVRNWPAGPVEIYSVRESTPLEDMQAKHEMIRQELLAAGRDPLAERLLALLG